MRSLKTVCEETVRRLEDLISTADGGYVICSVSKLTDAANQLANALHDQQFGNDQERIDYTRDLDIQSYGGSADSSKIEIEKE